jgi:putative ABC transport system permease protein
VADVRWRKVARDLGLHWPRTLLVVLAIAVALAGAGTVLVSWALVRRSTQEGFLAANPRAATLWVDSLNPAALALIRSTPGVRTAEPRRTLSLPLMVRGSWVPGVLFVADEPAQLTIGRLAPSSGAWPPPLGAIAIEGSSLSFAPAALGDSVGFTNGSGAVVLAPITTIVRDVVLAPGWMEHVVYAWTSHATAAQLGLSAGADEVQLVVDDPGLTRAAVLAIARAASQRLEEAGRRVRDIDVPEPGEHIHAAQMDSLLLTQGAFGALALATSVFLIVNLLSAMLTAEVRQVGIMKVLGGDRRSLAPLYLVHAGVLGALATAIALPVALVAGRRYADLRGEMLNFDMSTIAIPWWTILLLAATGILLPMIAGWLPIARGLGIPVASALRDQGMVDDEVPLVAARLGGWSRVLALSLRNAFRRRRRLLLTVGALASGGALFIASRNLGRAVVGSMDLIYGSQQYAFTVRLARPSDEAAAIVAAVPGVRAAEGWTAERAMIEGPGGREVLPIVGIPAGSTMLQWENPQATCIPFRDDCGPLSLAVSRSLVRFVPGLAVGDSLVTDVRGTVTRWHVTAIFDGPPTPVAYTRATTLALAAGDRAPGSVVVATDLASLPSQVDLIARVRAALDAGGIPVSSTVRLEESRRVTEDHLLMVVQFLGAMGWLMIVVGGMGLASTMGLAVLERRREIAVMRAIGASHLAIGTLVEFEGIIIGILAWLVAIPLSLPFSLALGEAFSRIMFRVPVQAVPVATAVFTWLAVTLAVALIATAWPAWQAMSRPVAAGLHHE